VTATKDASEGDLPVDAEPDEVKHFLANVDADNRW
jgi:hypothetical protein